VPEPGHTLEREPRRLLLPDVRPGRAHRIERVDEAGAEVAIAKVRYYLERRDPEFKQKMAEVPPACKARLNLQVPANFFLIK
jgi:hypothetical protein